MRSEQERSRSPRPREATAGSPQDILQVAVSQEHSKAIALTLSFASSRFQHYPGETEGKPCLAEKQITKTKNTKHVLQSPNLAEAV